MSSGFMEIIKSLQNITEGCVSRMHNTPMKKKTIKDFELLYVRVYKEVRTWNKGLFQQIQACQKKKVDPENVSLGLLLVFSYKTCFVRVQVLPLGGSPIFSKSHEQQCKIQEKLGK